MLRARLGSAAAILIPLVGLLTADYYANFGAPGIWIAPLGLIIGLMAASEVLDLLRTPGYQPLAETTYTGVGIIIAAACVPIVWRLFAPYPATCPVGAHGWPFLATAVAMMIVFMGEMRRFEQPGTVMVNLALSLMTVVYVAIPIALAAILRQFHDNAWGLAALVSVVFIVKVSDSGAYFTGKSFGRRKLAPRLSPGKTIEGGIGGVLAAVLAAWIFFYFIAPVMTGSAIQQPWWGIVVYGAVLALAGLIGDLSESLIKRDVKRKDSSSWLPGLGGVLDIMDSLLFAIPAAYMCWVLGIVRAG